MVLAILLIAVVILFTIHLYRKYDRAEGILAFICGLLLACVAYFSIAALAGVAVSEDNPYELKGHITIQVVNDGSATVGRFGLFSGYVNEEWRYYYYYPTNSINGGTSYKLGWIPAVSTKIVESNDQPPRINVYKTDDTPYMGWAIFYIPTLHTQYEIIVPEGTVVQQYTFDAQ